MRKNVGRPIEKPNRKKIGLSIDENTNIKIDYLTNNLGKTKSKIVEEAIHLYYENNLKIKKDLETLHRSKDDPYYKLKDMMINSFND